MRKTVPFLAAWFLAGLGAVALGSAGVSLVSRQVTDQRPAPLTPGQVEALVREEATATTAPSTTTTTVTIPPPTTVVPATTAPSGPGGGTVATSPPPTQAAPPPTTQAPPPPPAPTTKTYDLVGGTVTVRFSASGVTVLAATPKAGFSVEVSSAHSNGKRVEFENDDHRSRVDAWWDGGPREEVREED